MQESPANITDGKGGSSAPAFRGGVAGVLWFFVALVGCLYIYFLNGGPTFYFDTGSYIDRGYGLLSHFFDIPTVRNAALNLDGSVVAELDPKETVRAVGGTRSPVYSVIVGGLASLRHLEAIAWIHAALVLAAIWLPIRITARHFFADMSVAKSVGLTVLLSSLGSLPFYVAFIMPDIFAPILILMLATLTAYSRTMLWWEILFAFSLAGLAIVVHISHIAMAVLLFPCILVLAFLYSRKMWWFAPLLVAMLLGVGAGEQFGFRAAVSSNSGKEVTILPFLTARLIHDQVGYDYLESHCPSDDIPTCKLFQSLSISDDPMRFTASHILFSRESHLGSFQFIEYSEQKEIANRQFGFFFDVLKQYPFRTAISFLRNTLVQVKMNSVDMTLQSAEIIKFMDALNGLSDGGFEDGRLTSDVSWLGPVNILHQLLYGISFSVAAVLVLWPRLLPGQVRILVIVIGLGILANAFILGGVSQPATRYGSRVIWLLPFAATFCLIFTPYFAGSWNNQSAVAKDGKVATGRKT
ncbi:MAG: hypothetical protein V3V25_00255 [Paracoccaceae bacterium]